MPGSVALLSVCERKHKRHIYTMPQMSLLISVGTHSVVKS